MSERLEWSIQANGGVAEVELTGPVDEDADFASLAGELAVHKQLRLDLSNVKRINSCGVREWVNFIRGVQEKSEVELARCSPAIVSQINMISNFVGSARIISVQAPYVCDDCGQEETVLFDLNSGDRPELPERECPKCSSIMEFDDIEESYFDFLS